MEINDDYMEIKVGSAGVIPLFQEPNMRYFVLVGLFLKPNPLEIALIPFIA